MEENEGRSDTQTSSFLSSSFPWLEEVGREKEEESRRW